MAISTENRMLDVPPQMVLTIASGIENPALIAERYGFGEDQWAALKVFEPFVKLIDAKRAELKASGFTFRAKCGLISELLLDELYARATSEDASFGMVLDMAKWTSKAAGLDAPVKQEQASGPAFSITINLGGGKSVHVGSVPAKPQDITDVEPEEYGCDADLGEVPWHLRAARSELCLESE